MTAVSRYWLVQKLKADYALKVIFNFLRGSLCLFHHHILNYIELLKEERGSF